MSKKKEMLVVDVIQSDKEYDIEAKKGNSDTLNEDISYKGFYSLAEVEHYLLHVPVPPQIGIENIILYTQETDYNAKRWDDLCEQLIEMGRMK